MQSKVNLVGIEALNELDSSDARIIGYLVWYSIFDADIPREHLEELLHECNLEQYMLNSIHPNDAFRRAAKSIEKKSKNEDNNYSGVTQNYLVSGFDTTTEIVRHLVVETIDKNNQSLHYDPETAVIKFEKETENISYSSKTARAASIAEEVKDMYFHCLNYYGSRHIRELVSKVLASMAPIPVRPTGGVFFVPAKHEAKLINLLSLIKKIGESEGFKVPLVNSLENKDMVRLKLDTHIRAAIQESANFLRSGSDNGAVGKKALTNIQEILKNFSDYEDACSLSLEEMNDMTGILKKQAAVIIDRITEIKANK
jgi:hypothetical protein